MEASNILLSLPNSTKHSSSQIINRLRIKRSTIYNIIRQGSLRNDGESLSRSGCPRAVTESDKQYVIIKIECNPFIIYQELRNATGILVSDTVFVRILKKSGYRHWKAQKQPKLTADHAKLQYQWALTRKD